MLYGTEPIQQMLDNRTSDWRNDILQGERLRSSKMFKQFKTTIKSANGVVINLKRREVKRFSKVPFNTHLIACVLR